MTKRKWGDPLLYSAWTAISKYPKLRGLKDKNVFLPFGELQFLDQDARMVGFQWQELASCLVDGRLFTVPLHSGLGRRDWVLMCPSWELFSQFTLNSLQLPLPPSPRTQHSDRHIVGASCKFCWHAIPNPKTFQPPGNNSEKNLWEQPNQQEPSILLEDATALGVPEPGGKKGLWVPWKGSLCVAQVPWQSRGMATELAQCYIPNHPSLNQDPKPRPILGLYAKELTSALCNLSQAHVYEMSHESKRTRGSRTGAPGKRSLTTLKSQWPCQENTIIP